jgi:hypothetical protein
VTEVHEVREKSRKAVKETIGFKSRSIVSGKL